VAVVLVGMSMIVVEVVDSGELRSRSIRGVISIVLVLAIIKGKIPV
jgi:hypothetical protein